MISFIVKPFLLDFVYGFESINKAGDSVEIRMGVLYDADIHLYLDAQELEKSHQDSDYWGYTFTMPDKDVVITAKAYMKDEMASSSENTKVPLGNVQYVRTDGYRDDVQYPKTLWITSLEEMNTYVEANQELYHLNFNGFTDAVKQYELQPMIQRTIPEVGTDDMAEWHILIEISKEYGASKSELQLPSITNVYLTSNWNEP